MVDIYVMYSVSALELLKKQFLIFMNFFYIHYSKFQYFTIYVLSYSCIVYSISLDKFERTLHKTIMSTKTRGKF